MRWDESLNKFNDEKSIYKTCDRQKWILKNCM